MKAPYSLGGAIFERAKVMSQVSGSAWLVGKGEIPVVG